MSETRHFIGIDIGGTNTKVALVDSLGQLSHLDRVLMKEVQPATIEGYLHCVLDRVDRIIATSGQRLSGIGISTPGVQRVDGRGTLYSVNVPMLNQFDLWQFFRDQYGVQVRVMNDLVSHSLAEHRFGTGRGVGRFLCVSLGTGIGHTFIDHGQPSIVMNGISGDSGRMILDPQSDEADSSQVFGSAEALCGVAAIERLAKARGLQAVTAHEVISAAREKQELAARDIMAVISRRLAHLLMNLSSIYFPEVIAITGGQTEAGDFFIEECRQEFSRMSGIFFQDYFKAIGEAHEITIVKAEAGGLAGLTGSIVPLLDLSTKRDQ